MKLALFVLLLASCSSIDCKKIDENARAFVAKFQQQKAEGGKRFDVACKCKDCDGWHCDTYVTCVVVVDGVPWLRDIDCNNSGCWFEGGCWFEE
jgi:hypothetical protein